MTSESPADPPKDEARGTRGTQGTEPPNKPTEEVLYDDFGLPIRRPRARTPVVDSSESEDEKFEDAVASKSASREKITLPENEGNTTSDEGKSGVETQNEVTRESANHDDDHAQANGFVMELVKKVEEREEKAKQDAVQAKDIIEPAETKKIPEDAQGSEVTKKDETVGQEQMTTEQKAEQKDGVKAVQVQQNGPEEVHQSEAVVKDKVEQNVPSKNGDKPLETKQDAPEKDPQRDSTLPHKTTQPSSSHRHQTSVASVSEYSHQHALMKPKKEEKEEDEGEWQTMPAYAQYDMYDDDNRLIAKENAAELEDMSGYGNVGGAAKGYTRVIMDDDADSQTSLDDNTAYLFKEKSTALYDEDEEVRDPLTQMQTTKNLLTEGQRVAYVGLARLAMVEMEKKFSKIERGKKTKKTLDSQAETTKMWSQKIMLRLYGHMDINTSEQVMIEQLSDHGVVPADLTPALMANARVKNPAAEEEESSNDLASEKQSIPSPRLDVPKDPEKSSSSLDLPDGVESPPPPPYEEQQHFDYPEVKTPSQLPTTKTLDIDLRWTVLCDLFLVLIADSVYDSRSRELFEQVGKYLSVDWLEICRFEKRVTDALEMQEQADKENWNEDDHMQSRAKRARNRRIAMMGLATVGGGLVIGLSAGLLAPFIGAGLAAGFTTIGIGGTSTFFAGAGGAALVASTGVVTGSTVGVRAANRRTGAVKTFEYRPLHNNKRTHLIITLAGWMNGKVDDVRLPYSTVDPIMGDIYSVLWEPDMLRSMGDTINILATEALTQGLQQVLGGTILTALMSAMTLPLALTKLSYLIDNPWSVSQARADMAGLILADSIIDRNLGTRPITLVGFSLGARVLISCLKELANRGAYGLVQNVYMFGTPMVANTEDYVKARTIVPGRFVNGYATNDWILGYLFRATTGGIMRVAGLAPIQIPTIENVNVTDLVPGHMAYRAAMPKLLREVGWIVESDEFTEIEDPDPENHDKRQRELINEIEEARKDLEKKAAEKEKKGVKLSWWKKKKTDKKDWEVYNEKSTLPQQHPVDKDADPATIAENPIMFDIDAIRREVATLALESQEYNAAAEFEIKEIKSTLPPMKIDISTMPQTSPHSTLRETKSYNDSLGTTTLGVKGSSNTDLPANAPSHPSASNYQVRKSFEEYDEFDAPEAGPVEMTFDSSFRDPPTPTPPASKSPAPPAFETPGKSTSWEATPSTKTWDTTPNTSTLDTPSTWNDPPAPERPQLVTAKTESHLGTSTGANINPSYNAWADEFEDDFGKEKEVKMSFM